MSNRIVTLPSQLPFASGVFVSLTHFWFPFRRPHAGAKSKGQKLEPNTWRSGNLPGKVPESPGSVRDGPPAPVAAPPTSPPRPSRLALRAGSGPGRRDEAPASLPAGSIGPHPSAPGAGPPPSRSPPAARTASASRRRPRGRRCHSRRHAAAAAPGGGERGPARSSGSAAPAACALPRCFGAAPRPLPPGQRGRGEAPGVGAAGLSDPGSRAGLPGSTA